MENKSETTIANYKNILRKILQDINKPILIWTYDDVLNWINSYAQGKKESSVNSNISVISCLLTYCKIEGYIEKVPIKNRWRRKLPKPMPRYLNNTDISKVRIKAEKLPLRDRALVELLFSSGCRIGEVYNLEIKDVDLEMRTAKVTGKGKKIRYINFSETCKILLNDYINSRQEKDGFLFLNKNNRLSIRSMQKIISNLGVIAGISKQISPHNFRHTFGTQLAIKGAGIEFIQRELGHSDSNITTRYTNLPVEEIRKEYTRCMG